MFVYLIPIVIILVLGWVSFLVLVVGDLFQFGPWVVVLVMIIGDIRQFDPDLASINDLLSAVEVCGVSWERHHCLQIVCFDPRRGVVVDLGFYGDSHEKDFSSTWAENRRNDIISGEI